MENKQYETNSLFVGWGITTREQSFSGSELEKTQGWSYFFMASKNELKSSWCIWGTKKLHKHIRNEKVMAPRSRGVK